jgi:hypothetical protein
MTIVDLAFRSQRNAGHRRALMRRAAVTVGSSVRLDFMQRKGVPYDSDRGSWPKTAHGSKVFHWALGYVLQL